MKFLTVEEVGDILAITPRTVRSLVSKGTIKAVKIGKFLRINEEDLKRMVEL
jgi:excisionase family DNA binding protein